MFKIWPLIKSPHHRVFLTLTATGRLHHELPNGSCLCANAGAVVWGKRGQLKCLTEAFHRVLKYVYLKGTVNKRMDNCIHTLLKYSRDKAFDRLAKLEKGKTSSRIKAIMDRHHSSQSLLLSCNVTKTSDTSWLVDSQTNTGSTYTVTLENEQCPFQCHISCSVCRVCIHMYSCTCADALVHGTICKHIHLTVQSMGPSKFARDDATKSSQITTILATVQQTETTTDPLLRQVRNKLSVLSACVNQYADRDTLLAINKHLSTCLSVVQLHKSNQPANKKLTQQRPFVSTKRKRGPARIRLAKPTPAEKESVKKLLSSPNPLLLTQTTIGKDTYVHTYTSVNMFILSQRN